jgi:hypothetical protein
VRIAEIAPQRSLRLLGVLNTLRQMYYAGRSIWWNSSSILTIEAMSIYSAKQELGAEARETDNGFSYQAPMPASLLNWSFHPEYVHREGDGVGAGVVRGLI